jgi:tetratricopeptide (TPR) repeat protein
MASAAPKAQSIAPGAPQSAPATGITTSLLVVAALTAAISLIICLKLWFDSATVTPAEILRLANRQYSAGNVELAGELAVRAELTDETDLELASQRHFLIGAGYARIVLDSQDAAVRHPAVRLAIDHLAAASADWPPGCEDEGDRLLSEMYYRAGNFARAVQPLQALIDRDPSYRDAVVPTMVRCLLRGGDDPLRHAVSLLDETLRSPGKSPALQEELENLRAECLTRLGQFDAARQQLRATLAKAEQRADEDPTASEVSTSATELLLAAVDVSEAVTRFGPGSPRDQKVRPEVVQFLAPAMKTLLRLQRDASPDIASRTPRWIARGLLCAGDPADALSYLSAARLRQPFDGEGVAAGLTEIECLVAQGSSREAVQTVRYLIAEIGSEARYDGSVVDLASFRQRLQNILTQLRDQGETEACIDVARSLAPIFSADHALFEEGVALRHAADKLALPLQPIGSVRQREQSVAARALYAQAGNAFEASARLRYESTNYSDTLWEAIDAMQQSGQFNRSIELLSDYLRYESRIRHPRALIAQGRALLANGDPAAAIKPLTECMDDFPRDPLCYDARLLAARAMAEMDQLEEAKSLLDNNLTDGSLTPQSLTWKLSLFALGEVLWRRCHESHTNATIKARLERQLSSLESLRENQPKITEAIARLGEAVTRYWPDPQAVQAATLLAKANRLAAELPQAESQVPDVLESTRRRLVRQREQFLQNALEAHRRIRKELAKTEDERMLELPEQILFQMALMGEADTMFELGQYEPSADAYRTISQRYMNEPPALEAMLGQVRCLRELNRQREARLVIRQAAMVLGRIPSEWDDRFEQMTRYDRRHWEELLAWLDSGPMPQDSDS